MKNLKVNKKGLAMLGLATALTLTGCESDNSENHVHLYLTIGDEVIAFKECEGYQIVTNGGYGAKYYHIYDLEGNEIYNGYSSNCLMIEIDDEHEEEIENLIEKDNEKIRVYTLDK